MNTLNQFCNGFKFRNIQAIFENFENPSLIGPLLWRNVPKDCKTSSSRKLSL